MGEKLTNRQKKDFAKSLYLREHVTQKEIAERVGASCVTVNKWVNQEGWERLKASLSVTRDEQLANMYNQITEINTNIAGRKEGERYPTSKESDTINKIASAIERLERETGVADIISVSRGLLDFVRRSDPDKALEISYYFDAYIKEKIHG